MFFHDNELQYDVEGTTSDRFIVPLSEIHNYIVTISGLAVFDIIRCTGIAEREC